MYVDDHFALAMLPLGNVVVGIQPARGYHIDPSASYHDPDAAAARLSRVLCLAAPEFGAHAIIHMGKHGNLEWLPGKALALGRLLPGGRARPCPTSTRSSSTTRAKARRRSAGRPR